jgi:hypothetical protein
MFRSTLLRFALLGGALSAIAGGVFAVNRWRTRWGVDPEAVDRTLPADDLVPEPTHTETRGIVIDAPPRDVWPWLVQMGYGRAGWYSYDGLDMKGRSADTIHPEWQSLNVGDILPTHPGGGFEIRVLEEGRALAVFTNTAIASAQAAAFAGRPEPVPAGLQLSGSIIRTTPPDFAASWTFVLDPLSGDRTRLVERVRVWYGLGTALSALTGPAFGFGVFLMTRRQMLGIRDRVENLAQEGAAQPAELETPGDVPGEPSARNGHGPVDAADLVSAAAAS